MNIAGNDFSQIISIDCHTVGFDSQEHESQYPEISKMTAGKIPKIYEW